MRPFLPRAGPEAPGKGAAAARWKLRIMNEDGLVLHEGPVNAVGGGK